MPGRSACHPSTTINTYGAAPFLRLSGLGPRGPGRVAYRASGPPGQTRINSLGPLGRTAHRAKTHAGWRCRQVRPGHWLWRTPYGRDYEVDNWGARVRVPPERRPSLTALALLRCLDRAPSAPPG